MWYRYKLLINREDRKDSWGVISIQAELMNKIG